MPDRFGELAISSRMFAEATVDFRRLVDTVAERFGTLIGDGCYLRLVAEDATTLVPVATYHRDPEVRRYLREINERIPLSVGEGIAGKVVATGDIAFLPDVPPEVLRSRVKPEFAPIFERIGITSLIAIPLRARGANIGFLALVRTGIDRPAYTPAELGLAREHTDRAALAIQNGRLVETLERRVEQRARTLETANRELEAFAFSVSHDLRSPLRAIDGYSRILQEDHGSALDPEAQRLLDIMRASARRMNQLVDDVLRLSRLGHRGIEPVADVDMRSVVDDAIAAARASSPRPIAIQIGSLPPARGNRALLEQVWSQLIANAIKFSPGEIAIEIDAAEADGELRYSLRDHGIGFDPARADRLFGMFQRLHDDPAFEGNGVGLALVQRIISAHGGRVWAEGRPDQGAIFSFALAVRSDTHRTPRTPRTPTISHT